MWIPAAVLTVIGATTMLAADVPGVSPMLKDGVAIGCLGLALFWVLRSLPIMNKQNADTIKEVCETFEDRLRIMGEVSAKHHAASNETLQRMIMHCASKK